MFDKFLTPKKRDNDARIEHSVVKTPAVPLEVLEFMPKNGSAMMASSGGVKQHWQINTTEDLMPSPGTLTHYRDEGYATSTSFSPVPDTGVLNEEQQSPKPGSSVSVPASILTPVSEYFEVLTSRAGPVWASLTIWRLFTTTIVAFALVYLPYFILSPQTLDAGLLMVYAKLLEIVLYDVGVSTGWVVKHVTLGFSDAYYA